MGKFGKKTVVSADLSNFMLGAMGPSGFGKTTLMCNVGHKLFGDDGYMIFDMGLEDGVKAIAGAIAERIPNYGKLKEVVEDIVKNKDTDYPNLKLVVIDTLDAYFEVVEDYVIKDWNASNAGNPNFVKAKSINSVEGGYGRGMERVVDTAKKVISRLNSVGVGVWWTAHVKEKEQADLYTGKNFTTITANMSMKYFNAIKNSSHVVACGYYDREIEKVAVGDKNPVTNKTKERSTLIDETRKIKFRDDMLVADAKSRFAHIIDEIPLDADAFIKAVQDAIAAEANGKPELAPATRKIEAPKIVESTSSYDKVENDEDTPPFDVDTPSEPAADAEVLALGADEREKIIEDIRLSFKDLPMDVKKRIKTLRGESSLEASSDEVLLQIKAIIDSELRIEID